MARIRGDLRMKAADLDRKVVLLEPQAGAVDSFGQPTEAAPLRHDAFAKKMDFGGREVVSQGVDAATLTTRFFFDYGSFPSLSADWQIEYEGEVWEITAPPQELGRKAFWEVVAARRRGGT